MKTLKDLFDLFRQTLTEWNEDKAPRLAAALAYYTAFSLAPLLVIVIAVAGLILGETRVREDILRQVEISTGTGASELIEGLISSTTNLGSGIISTIISVITLLLGAIGAFTQLQGALDTIWDVEPPPQQPGLGGILGFLRDNLLSFGMILMIGFLLLVSLVVSTVLASVTEFVTGSFVGVTLLVQIVTFAINFGIITILFAAIFKFLPHTTVQWRHVWIGAALTTLLFLVGKQLLSLYLARTSTESTYGAAGSLVVILLWIYYSAQLILFGAEFTQVYAKRSGEKRTHEMPLPAAYSGEEPVPLLPSRTATTRSRQDKGGILSGLIFGIGLIITSFIASRFDRSKPEA